MKGTSSTSTEPVPVTPKTACQPIVDKRALPGGRSLWLWVVAGFLILAVVWTAMFKASRLADTRSVPLAAPGGRP